VLSLVFRHLRVYIPFSSAQLITYNFVRILFVASRIISLNIFQFFCLSVCGRSKLAHF